jgi:hypothetical protein
MRVDRVEITDCDLKFRPRRPALCAYVFTEQGVAMLSSVLASERAIAANIEIMRAFVKLCECGGGSPPGSYYL